MAAAATDLAGIGSALGEAHTAAAVPTVALVPAAADEVSAGVAHLFSRYAEDFQGLAGKATAFHGQFAQNLKTSAASYTSAEDAIASLLQGFKGTLKSQLTATRDILGRHFPFVQEPLAQELFSVVASVVFAVLSVGFFVVVVPIAVVLQMIESFIQRLGLLLP
jgi:PE family